MRRTMLAVCLALAAATAQGAQTLTRDGVVALGGASAPAGSRPWILVNDGSFEFGECELGSAWTCASTAGCSWILDPLYAWGYPAYEGQLAAWLGGFCNGAPSSHSFCQELFMPDASWGSWLLGWQFMGYVNGACSTMLLTIDGQESWRHTMRAQDHTFGTWSQWGEEVGFSAYPGIAHTICFEWEPCPDGVDNDNMLIDYVMIDYWVADIATAQSSFSTIKAHY